MSEQLGANWGNVPLSLSYEAKQSRDAPENGLLASGILLISLQSNVSGRLPAIDPDRAMCGNLSSQ